MILLFLFLMTPLFGQSYYESDGLGIAGSKVNTIEDSQWVLEVSDSDGQLIKTLYKDQSEYKRWEQNDSYDKGLYIIREKYYYKDSLRTETIQMKDGRILEETSFNSEGSFLNRKEFTYDQEKRLISISTFDEDGQEQKSDDLLYRLDNSLREIEGSEGTSIEWRTGDFNKQYLDTLYINEDNAASIFRFKNNELISSKTVVDDLDTEEVIYEYDSQHRLTKELRKNHLKDERIEIIYNESGNTINRNVYKNNFLESIEQNIYRGSQLIRTVQQSRGLKIESRYEYKEGESEPYKTTYFRNSMIVKQVEQTDEGLIETLYRNGTEAVRRLVGDKDS